MRGGQAWQLSDHSAFLDLTFSTGGCTCDSTGWQVKPLAELGAPEPAGK